MRWPLFDDLEANPYAVNRLLRLLILVLLIGLTISLTKQIQYNRNLRQLILDTCP